MENKTLPELNHIKHLVGTLVLPGEILFPVERCVSMQEWIIGPGLCIQWKHDNDNDTPRHTGSVTVCQAGLLRFREPNALWVDLADIKTYTRSYGDKVLGQIIHKTTDLFLVYLGAASAEIASLSYLNFEGATKNFRPDVRVGDLVYARVITKETDVEPDLSCVEESGKSNGMGVIGRDSGLLLPPISLDTAEKLMLPKQYPPLLQQIGQRVPFEVVVGANGWVWVKADSTPALTMIGNFIHIADKTAFRIPLESVSAYCSHFTVK